MCRSQPKLFGFQISFNAPGTPSSAVERVLRYASKQTFGPSSEAVWFLEDTLPLGLRGCFVFRKSVAPWSLLLIRTDPCVARTVPARCPHGARTVPARCPHGAMEHLREVVERSDNERVREKMCVRECKMPLYVHPNDTPICKRVPTVNPS